MTITLVTGKTGNGKTLFAITEIEKRRLEEKRDVYYNGIPDLKLPWIPFENTKEWNTLPSGAIIVFDEAQNTFRPRPNGSAVPSHVAALEVHRKQGHDIYALSQQPTFLDTHIRKLTDVHYHLMRKFGAEESVVHKFFTCKDDADKSRTGSITQDWAYPKENYALYKSAELHTIKKSMPFRYMLRYIIPVVVIALLGLAYYILHGVATRDVRPDIPESQLEPKVGTYQSGHADKKEDPNQYYIDRTPRVSGLPQTAAVYDEVTKPTIAPLPAACVLIRKTCTCYTQQATKLAVDDATCRQIVSNGYFVDFENKVIPADRPSNQSSQMVAERNVTEADLVGETVAPASVEVPTAGRNPSKSLRGAKAPPVRYISPYPKGT